MNRNHTTLALVAVLALGGVASAEDDVTSLSYIAYLERYATVQPAAQSDSLEATLNMPVVAGDRIDTARGARVEVRLADGSLLWMDEYTTVSFDAIAFSRESTSDRTVLYLSEGGLVVDVPQTAYAAEPLRLDSASSTVYLHGPGLFRVDALRSGTLRLEVWEGLGEVSTAAGGELVRAGTAAEVAAGDILRTERALSEDDDFAYWVGQRRAPPQGESSRHLDLQYARQGSVLDSYGSWVYVDTVGSWAWRPQVAVGWRPYTAGRWYWTPVGWNWISYEPWGWLPYHYGSWYHDVRFGWVWGWDDLWAPAWVSWIHWPGYVGWCPRGYYDGWYWDHYGDPGWGGGGAGRPDRTSVLPPRLDRTGSTIRTRATLDLRGQADPRQLDPGAWTVVRTGDFNSPHLPRLVTTPDRAVRSGGVVDRATVHTGPLVTAAPGAQPVSRVLEGGFRDVGTGRGDLTPILARRGDLNPRDAERLAAPTSAASIVRRAPAPVAPSIAPAPARGRTTVAPAPAREVERSTPNLHRPTLGSSGGVRTPVTPERMPARPPVVRPSSPAAPSAVTPRAPSSVRPAPAPAVRPAPSSPAPSSSSYVPRSSGSRPVIVPRSSPSVAPPSAVRPPQATPSTPSVRSSPRSSSSAVRPSPRASSAPSRSYSPPSRPSRSGSSVKPRSGGSGS